MDLLNILELRTLQFHHFHKLFLKKNITVIGKVLAFPATIPKSDVEVSTHSWMPCFPSWKISAVKCIAVNGGPTCLSQLSLTMHNQVNNIHSRSKKLTDMVRRKTTLSKNLCRIQDS